VRPKQVVGNFEALYTQAGDPQSKEYLTQAGDAIAAKLRERFPGLFDDTSFSQGSLKSWDRSVIKLLGDKSAELDHSKTQELFDLRRGRFVIENADQVRAIRTILADDNLRSELGIEFALDRFANPSATHYRDINMRIRLPNGHIAEIQVNQRDMLAAAEFTHDAYEDADTIKRRAQVEREDLLDIDRSNRKLLTNYAQDVHDLGAQRFAGAEELLNDAGRARLARDFTRRRKSDPDYEPGKTVQTGHKYDAMLENGLPPLDKAEVYGGEGAKALRINAGIEVDRFPVDMLDLGGMRKPSLVEIFGKHAGMIGIVVVPLALAADGADAQEIGLGLVEAAIPFASAAIAAGENRPLETAMRSIEEIPLAGLVVTEAARPLARHLDQDVDASIGETILSLANAALGEADVDRELVEVFQALPDKHSADMPPEIESLVEFKRLIAISEQKLQNAGEKTDRDSAGIELARFQRLFVDQYNDLSADGGLDLVVDWLADNPPELLSTASPPARQTTPVHPHTYSSVPQP
jgi:hypothetical protein